MTKEKIRNQILQKRKSLADKTKNEWDLNLNRSLCQWVLEHKQETIHCYLPMIEEVDLTHFLEYCLRKQIKMVVPKVKRKPFLEHLVLSSLKELESGPMGTRHPKNAQLFSGDIDLIVVPGLAFDRKGYRIGYGGGFYDHFLVNFPNAFKLAVCYPYQLFPELPREEHDIAVDLIFCPQAPDKFSYEWERVHFI